MALGCASVWQSIVTLVPDGAPTNCVFRNIRGETYETKKYDTINTMIEKLVGVSHVFLIKNTSEPGEWEYTNYRII